MQKTKNNALKPHIHANQPPKPNKTYLTPNRGAYENCTHTEPRSTPRKKQVEIYNIGSEPQTTVRTIAEIAAEEMRLQDVKFKFKGGVDGGRGWKGDFKTLLLDISKIRTVIDVFTPFSILS